VSLIRKRRCPNCGCGGDDTCGCGCPCGTEGGLEACDGRIAFPLDVTMSITAASGETDMWIEGVGMDGRLYSSQWAIDQFIAETDPGVLESWGVPPDHPAQHPGVMIKVKSKWEVVGSSYTLTDNTSVGCDNAHIGLLVKRKALNGDEYVFDTMEGMPRLKNTVTLLDTVRRSGNDFEGIVYVNDGNFSYHYPGGINTEEYYVENHTYQDVALADEGDWNKRFESSVHVDSYGNVSFRTFVMFQSSTSYGSTGGGRITYRNNFYADHYDPPSGTPYETQSENHHYKNIGPLHAFPVTGGYHTVQKWDEALSFSVPPGPGEPNPSVCEGDVETEYVDPFTDTFTFTPGSLDDPSGVFWPPRSGAYFTASSYIDRDPAYANYNFVTGMEATATVGERSNPGAQDCDRCYDAVLKVTDGDTDEQRIIWQGQLRQLMSSRLTVGEDPDSRGDWPSTPIWTGIDEDGRQFHLARGGKSLWIGNLFTGIEFQGIPYSQRYNFKGTGDCPSTIIEAEAEVLEQPTFSSTGEGTPASPRVTHSSTRLKIDVVELSLSPMTCDPCLDDPCDDPCDSQVIKWNTGEESSGGFDLHWDVETSNGGGVFTAATIVTFPNGAWVTPASDATWIGIDEFGSGYGGVRIYRTKITVIGGITEDIAGLIASDNHVLSITINGIVRLTTFDQPEDNEFSVKTAFLLLKEWFGVGENVVEFEIEDESDAAGLEVEWVD
jgi:hypothetical protein